MTVLVLAAIVGVVVGGLIGFWGGYFTGWHARPRRAVTIDLTGVDADDWFQQPRPIIRVPTR